MPDIREIWVHMKAVLRTARQIVNTELASLNLTGAEGDILFHLLSTNDGFSQEKLADSLDIGKAAVSRTVHSLERKGYVHRERQADDSRTNRITLTEAARIAVDKIEHAYKTVYEVSLRGISESEFQRIGQLLEKVNENLNEQVSDR